MKFFIRTVTCLICALGYLILKTPFSPSEEKIHTIEAFSDYLQEEQEKQEPNRVIASIARPGEAVSIPTVTESFTKIVTPLTGQEKIVLVKSFHTDEAGFTRSAQDYLDHHTLFQDKQEYENVMNNLFAVARKTHSEELTNILKAEVERLQSQGDPNDTATASLIFLWTDQNEDLQTYLEAQRSPPPASAPESESNPGET